MRRLRGIAGLGIFIAIVGIGLRPSPPGVWLEDDLALSCLFSVRGPIAPPANVVVVSIDKTSADQLGLTKTVWPPPRHIHASVIRRLSLHGVSAIVMDVFFRDRRTVAEDDDLANAISESGRVALFESAERLNYGGSEIIQTRAPIAPLRDAALAIGVFPLADGTDVRHFWTFFDATSRRVPTLPSVALYIHTLPLLNRLLPLLERAGSNVKDLPHSVATASDSERLITTLGREIATHPEVARRALRLLDGGTDLGLSRDEQTRLAALVRLYAGDDTRYLNFYGPPGAIRTIPFHELLTERETSPIDLTGAVVFVGEGAVPALTNSDQRDTYRTVYSNHGVDLSGVEIAATAFANLLTNRTLRRAPLLADIGSLAAFALIAGFAARRLAWPYASLAVVLFGGAYYALAQYLFTHRGVLVPLGIPLVVQLPAILFAGVVSRYRHVRKQVAGEIETGAPPQLVRAVCLSTDIENYVTASAAMEPGDLARLMGEYYDDISRLVTARKGLVMGRAGDSVMCVWPGSRTDSTDSRSLETRAQRESTADQRARENACQAALEIRDAIDRFNARHPTPLRTRIGLHSGAVALGGVGGEYHVVGDVPNTASRIEGLNKVLGTTILASELVVRDQPALCLRRLGRFSLAGRPGELAVVEILGRLDAVDPQTQQRCHRFAAALAVFETGDLSRAGQMFELIADDDGQRGPARYYQRVCSGDPALSSPAGIPPVIPVESK